MSGNRTTELRISEPLRGFIRHQSNRAYIDGGQSRWLTEIADEIDAKHEQAVDDARIVEVETSYIDIEQGEVITRFVPEQAIAATLGDGTLTAEQVRTAIFNGSSYASYDGAQYYANGINMQAIADELNAELGGGNCARCAEDMGRYADSLCDPLKERIAELLRCLENDWHIRASWDGLRKFWCIELTEEGVWMRDAACGTLTAEQVREAIMSVDRWEKPMGNTGMTNTHLIIRDDGWQAIADELNARAERTCEIESSFLNDFTSEHECWYEFEMKCGYRFTWGEMEPPNCCPNCGGEIKAVDAE